MHVLGDDQKANERWGQLMYHQRQKTSVLSADMRLILGLAHFARVFLFRGRDDDILDKE